MPREQINVKDVSTKFPKTTTFDKLVAYLNLIFATVQILTPYLLDYLNIGKSISKVSNAFITPVIPAGYAFSIWVVIYFLSFLYSLDQLRFKKNNLNIYKNVGWVTAISFAMCAFWQLIAKFTSISPYTLLPMFFLFLSSITSLFLYKRYERNYKKSLIVYYTVSVLAGWVSIALFANISSVFIQYNVNFNLSITNISAILILIAFIIIVIIVLKTSNFIYTLTVLWGFIAILISNLFINLNELIFYEILISIIAISLSYYISKH